MDTKYKFDKESCLVEAALEVVHQMELGSVTKQLNTVAKVAFSDKSFLPDLGFPKRIDKGVFSEIPLAVYVEKWAGKYVAAFNNRPSVRAGKESKTKPDTVVKEILGCILYQEEQSTLDALERGHSLIMTVENLVGDLLEEYLSVKLVDYGWACCWGSTVISVDMCKSDPMQLIQIKTSDNSENSSSSKVRKGTSIQKWARRRSRKKDDFKWPELESILNCGCSLSEDDFRKFCKKVLTQNPKCLHFDWTPIKGQTTIVNLALAPKKWA
jgi:hypothetical protein